MTAHTGRPRVAARRAVGRSPLPSPRPSIGRFAPLASAPRDLADPKSSFGTARSDRWVTSGWVVEQDLRNAATQHELAIGLLQAVSATRKTKLGRTPPTGTTGLRPACEQLRLPYSSVYRRAMGWTWITLSDVERFNRFALPAETFTRMRKNADRAAAQLKERRRLPGPKPSVRARKFLQTLRTASPLPLRTSLHNAEQNGIGTPFLVGERMGFGRRVPVLDSWLLEDLDVSERCNPVEMLISQAVQAQSNELVRQVSVAPVLQALCELYQEAMLERGHSAALIVTLQIWLAIDSDPEVIDVVPSVVGADDRWTGTASGWPAFTTGSIGRGKPMAQGVFASEDMEVHIALAPDWLTSVWFGVGALIDGRFVVAVDRYSPDGRAAEVTVLALATNDWGDLAPTLQSCGVSWSDCDNPCLVTASGATHK